MGQELPHHTLQLLGYLCLCAFAKDPLCTDGNVSGDIARQAFVCAAGAGALDEAFKPFKNNGRFADCKPVIIR